MKYVLALSLYATIALSKASAQGEVPVNMYTGTPGISINLYTLTDHDLSETLTMSYNVNGVNLNSNSFYGVGWNLSVGGQISRQVRALPDDFTGSGRTGWLYNSNFSSILNFGNTADLSSSTCTDEQADQATILGYNYKIDTEPDLFSFSAGGYSGQFVFGNDKVIRLIPYQDISIVPTFANSPTDMTITGWTITTNAGVVYSFNDTCNTLRTLTKPNSIANPGPDGFNQSALSLLDRDFNFYNVAVSYTSSWMLTKAQSPTGAFLNYTYVTPANGSVSSNLPRNTEIFDVYWRMGNGINVSKAFFNLMDESIVSTSRIVSTITASTGVSASCDPISGIKLFDPKRSSPNFKNFLLGYTGGQLTTITEADGNSCTLMPPYQFSYNPYTGNGTGSSSKDFWGFYNGANNINNGGSPTSFPTVYVYPNEPANERYRLNRIPSYPPASGPEIILPGDANRTPNASAIISGTLSRIVYPTGGETDFTFEINQYYDARAGADQLGGGLRTKSITYFDGVNPAANITKNFSYVDGTGHSSGRLISRPAFAIPLWKYIVPLTNTGNGTTNQKTELYSNLVVKGTDSTWRKLTAVTSFDISNQDDTQGSSVGYAHVTVTRPGNGSAVFDYYLPAVYGDVTAGSGVTGWSPTTRKFARPSNCPPMNIIVNGETYGSPSFPNAEYDYERGLLWKKSEYNNSGTLVRFTQNTYQYLFKGTQPTNVVGLAYDRFANSDDMIYLYGRYSLLTDVTKVVASETVTTYDENNSARFATEATQYTYGSTYHRLPSQINKITSDGTIYGTSLKYTLDYSVPTPPTVPTDSTTWMIQLLKSANRTNTVIEQISSVTPPTGTTKTTGASLSIYRPFTSSPAKPLMRYQMAFRPGTPVADFVTSSTDGGYVFHSDSRYDLVKTINEYDNFDLPLSATGESHTTSAVLWGYGQRLPVAQINQARTISAGFSDFETNSVASFTMANDFYGTGRTGSNGVHPFATLTRTIVKPASAVNYLLSLWAKPQSGASSIALIVTLKDGSNNNISSNPYTFTYASGNTDYQYFTQLINVSALPSPFIIQIQGQSFSSPGSSSPSLLPLLDDIGFYPDYSSISSTTYDIPFGTNSATGPSGATAFTTYDALGRTKWLTDQDHNIRKRYTYNYIGQVTPSLVAMIPSIVGENGTNTPIQFVANPNTCISGSTTFQWDFGSGYTLAASSNISPTQSYSAPGTYPVNLKVINTDYGQATYSMNFTIGQALSASIINTPVDGSGWVTFTTSLINQTGSTLTYQWKQRNTGTSTWNNIGSNSGTFKPKLLPGTSIDVMCVVSTNDGRIASSNVLTVAN